MSQSVPSCACLSTGFGKHGPLADSERVARILNLGDRYFKNGVLKRSAFPQSHLLSKGLSMVRCDKMTVPEVQAAIDHAVQSVEGASFVGLAHCKAGPIRALTRIDNERALCVIDEPILGQKVMLAPCRAGNDDNAPGDPDNEAHAAAYLTDAAYPKEALIELQTTLANMFKVVATANDL